MNEKNVGFEEAMLICDARPKQFNPGISDNQFSVQVGLHLSPAWTGTVC
jgi:hypothetical protein